MVKIISVIVIISSYYCIAKPPQNYWPAIKGKWYFAGGGQSETSVIIYFRSPLNSNRLNFISMDSCEIWGQGNDDVYKPVKYAWKTNSDTICFTNPNDTLHFKIIKISDEELNFKPIFKY